MNKKNIVVFLIFTYNMCFSQDLVSEGSNRWILHTPDDGSTTMWVAPYTNNDWQWSLATQFLNNGNVLFKGNVGIGTTSPNAKLEVAGDAKINGTLYISGANTLNFSNYGGGLYMQDDSWIRTYGNKNFYHNTGIMRTDGIFHVGPNGDRFVVNSNGNVGIGTTNPSAKLDVNGNIAVGGLFAGSDASPLSKKIAAYNYQLIEAGAIDFLDFNSTRQATSIAFRAKNASNVPEEFMRIVGQDGNVGIGTTTPDQKLTVNGTIHSKEVIVDTAITPDYVFQKYYTGKSNLKSDYVMPTLTEIESFTKKNHHLPNVPSAQEVQQKGVSLGEMSNVLLQKVEELTLYAIEQNKYAIEQQKKLEEQNKTIATLVARLTSLEKK